MDHHPKCPEAPSALTVEKHYPKYITFMEAMCLEPEGNLATTISQLMQATTETATTATTHSNNSSAASRARMFPHMHIVNCLNINITEPSAVLQSVWNIKSAPIVRATYLLEKYLEERIIATYLLLLQQPIYYFSFCSNLLAS